MVKRAGRKKIELRDVMLAIDESVMPSDAAFARALGAGAPEKSFRKRAVHAAAPALQRDCTPVETASLPGRSVRPRAEEIEMFSGQQVAG